MGDYGAAVSQKGYDVKTCDDRFLVFSSAFQNLKIFSATEVSTTIPPGDDGEFTVNASTDVFTDNSHGLSNGDMLNFTSDDTLPSPLVESEEYIYYVINKTTNTFQVSETPGGSAVNLTDTGTGTHTWWTDVNEISISHNLGYFAPYLAVFNGGTTSGTATSYTDCDSNGTILDISQRTDELVLRIWDSFDDPNNSIGDTVYFTIYVFLDDFTSVSGTNINSGTTSGSSSTDYGIRISKSGYDVKTTADVNLVMSSSFASNIIHQKGTATGNTAHNLGYVPTVLCYAYDSDTPAHIQFNPREVSTTTLYTNNNDRYLIFKRKNN